jgi:hypothetical protein
MNHHPYRTPDEVDRDTDAAVERAIRTWRVCSLIAFGSAVTLSIAAWSDHSALLEERAEHMTWRAGHPEMRIVRVDEAARALRFEMGPSGCPKRVMVDHGAGFVDEHDWTDTFNLAPAATLRLVGEDIGVQAIGRFGPPVAPRPYQSDGLHVAP